MTMDTYGHLFPSQMKEPAIQLNDMRAALANGFQRPEALVLLRQSSPSAGAILTLSSDRPEGSSKG